MNDSVYEKSLFRHCLFAAALLNDVLIALERTNPLTFWLQESVCTQ